MSNQSRRAAPLMLIITGFAIGIDQATKALAGQVHGMVLVQHQRNDQFMLGVAGAGVPIEATLMALGIILFGGYAALEALRGRQPRWVPALLIGGALSNLVDRLLLGSVRDFLAIPHWIVFNLADVAVYIGLIGFVVTVVVRAIGTWRAVKQR